MPMHSNSFGVRGLVAGLGLMALLSPSAGAEDKVATMESGRLQFAIAIVQGVKTYSEPDNFDAKTAFEMPILRPHRIADERCVGGSGADCSGGTKWYKVERNDGATSGWTPANMIEIWNSRHALMPSELVEGGASVPGYCEDGDIDRLLAGDNDPCMRFSPALLDKNKDRSPFPVIGIREATHEGVKQAYLHVLVPTLYSNLVPIDESGGGPEAGEIARTQETIILVDATGSMAEELSATAKALTSMVDEISTTGGVDARFMVLAYRDTDGAEPGCPAMEGTVDSRGKLHFVSASEAQVFLSGVKACAGGDGPEAIWDAMYVIKDVQPEPGAQRTVILAGDAPAQEKTRGGEFLGVRVPAGKSQNEVLAELGSMMGQATTKFVGFLISNGLRATTDELVRHVNFLDKRLVSFSNDDETVRTELLSTIKEEYSATARTGRGSEMCEKELRYEGDKQVGLFCGDATDAVLAGRVRDIIGRDTPDDDLLVIRKVWIPVDRTLNDVALLSQAEASSTASAMAELSEKAKDDGSGCRAMGSEAWIAAMNTIIPGSTTTRSGATILTQPPVGAGLHKYWGLHVQSGSSIINYQPEQIASLGKEDCMELGSRLRGSSQTITKLQAIYTDTSFLWLPFDQIP